MLVMCMAAGAGLSFLGVGMMWVGQPWCGVYLSALFAALVFACGRCPGVRSRDAMLFAGTGALPLGMLLCQFRDANDSHLMSVAFVGGWYAAMLLGAAAARRARAPDARIVLCLLMLTLFHLAGAIHEVIAGFGESMQAFETGIRPPVGALALQLEQVRELILLEPAQTIWTRAGVRGEAGAQWILMVINSIAWGIAATLLLCLLAPRGHAAVLDPVRPATVS